MNLLRRLWLFLRIVFRWWEKPYKDFPGIRMDIKTSWEVAKIIHPPQVRRWVDMNPYQRVICLSVKR